MRSLSGTVILRLLLREHLMAAAKALVVKAGMLAQQPAARRDKTHLSIVSTWSRELKTAAASSIYGFVRVILLTVCT